MAMRTPREVFHHHFAALQAGDVDDVMSDYSRDSVVITPDGPARGIAAIARVSPCCSPKFLKPSGK